MADEWEQSIIDAVYAHDSVQLDMLFRSAGKHKWNSEVVSFLTKAASRCRKTVAEWVLQAAANVNFPDGSGRTPLMACAFTGDTDIASLLLHYGADVNINDYRYQENGETALHVTASYGHYEMAVLLLKHGAKILNPSKPGEIFTQTPIYNTILWKHPHLMELFLDHCEEHNHRLPLKLIKDALSSSIYHHSENCAIILLEHSFFPMQNKTMTLLNNNSSCINASFFYGAACRGLVKLISVIVGQHPQILQEEWLVQGSIPTKLRQHEHFLSWLMKCRKQPQSLAKLCKYTILSQLDSYYLPQVDVLPLPKSLKTFLKTMESAYHFTESQE